MLRKKRKIRKTRISGRLAIGLISYLAAASCEFVVISMASWTDFCSESRVRWSTGSTACMSILVTTRRFWGKMNSSRTFKFSSNPNTDDLMIFAEFWGKCDEKLRNVYLSSEGNATRNYEILISVLKEMQRGIMKCLFEF